MGVTLQQPSMSAGEISPSLYGRVDLALYHIGLRIARNVIVRQYGGCDNRPGFGFMAETKTSSKKSRLIRFRFNTEQAYAIELGHLYARFYVNGGPLESGGSPIELAMPYGEDDLFGIKYAQTADVITLVHKDYKPREMSRVDATTFQIEEFDPEDGPFRQPNVDKTKQVYVEEVAGAAEVGDTITIRANYDKWVANDVGALIKINEQEAVAQAWETNKSFGSTGQIRRSDGKNYRNTDTGTTGTVKPTHDEGIVDDGNVHWEFLDFGFGIARITSLTSASEVEAIVLSRMPDSLHHTLGSTVNITNITQASPAVVTTSGAHGYSDNQYVVLKSVGGMTEVNDKFYQIDVLTSTTFALYQRKDKNLQEPVDSTGFTAYTSGGTVQRANAVVVSYKPSYRFSDGAWSAKNGYPQVVSFYSGRRMFANTPANPDTGWMTKVEAYDSFSESSPLVDDDSISFTINAREVHEIRDFVPLDKLIILTAGGEWRVTEGQENVLSPITIGLKPQSYRGSSTVAPETVGNSVLYVQERGSKIRDLFYSFEIDGYDGNDLTIRADHLFERKTVVDMTFAQIPYSALFIVLSDGTLLTLTYMREQEVFGWARHDSAGGVFESVVSIPEGDEDAVYAIIRRTIDGSDVRYVERLTSRMYAELQDAKFVDSFLTYDGRNTTATTMTVTTGGGWTVNDTLTMTASASTFASGDVGDMLWLYDEDDPSINCRFLIMAFNSDTDVDVLPQTDVPAELQGVATDVWTFMRDTISGLDHLEGETVAALADGFDAGDFTVSGGSITLTAPGGVVHVGLKYASDVGTLSIAAPPNSRAGVVQDRKKVVTRVSLMLKDSYGVKAGPNENQLYEIKQRFNEDYDQQSTALSGIAEVNVDSQWDENGRILIRQDRPLPMTILSIMPEVRLEK